MKILVVFPHQLFDLSHVAQCNPQQIWLVEHPLFFNDAKYPIPFHKQKLVFHRATMKVYQQELDQAGYQTKYWVYNEIDSQKLVAEIANMNAEILYWDPVDEVLENRLTRQIKEQNIQSSKYESPNFVTTTRQIKKYFSEHKLYQTNFYKWQRERLNILMNADGSPLGGKLTYDTENRKKLPKDITPPAPPISNNVHPQVAKAIQEIEQEFPGNPGETDTWIYPVTRKSAEQAVTEFLETKLANYGKYQDAITTQSDFVYHSLLSPLINVGLVDPLEIVQRAETYISNNQAPIQAVEGFIRQILGWREFIRAVYVIQGNTMRQQNFWQETNSQEIPQAFWQANTGIPPVDDAITKANKYAYCHHIERLMVLGNFMLLCEFHPKAVYKWFMAMFIDAYDWVMVPNVYGMSQYSDGGTIVTKPYISSSNYIRKMSDYKTGEWADIWDSLYWSFIDTHKERLAGNARMGMMLAMRKKIPEATMQKHNMNAVKYKQNLFS